MILAECISCGTEIELAKQLKMGQAVTCPECAALLEVAWLDPVELDWPFDDDDDDDADEYDNEDY